MSKQKRWFVPVTIIEHGQKALVLAETKAEARRKARADEWEELSNADRFTVKIAGTVEEDQ